MKNILILIITIFVLTNCKNKETQTDNHGHDHAESDASHKNDKHEDIVITQEQFDVNKMQFGALSKQNFPEIVKTTGMIDVPPQSKQIITSFYGGFV
ncbi:MAG TPA: efflux transporter periplasmic adaptor subunit, partial [Crocinitomix sp.]|nr:efflux transporter periplasmic adaptor subunit [Crocinitomix sp.]